VRARIALFVLCLVGCSAYDDLALLDVELVEPAQIEPGGTLRIVGEGFPLGRSPIIDLHGIFYRPGAPPRDIDARLTGEVQAETLIEAPIDADTIESLGGRGTFEGMLRVAFVAANTRRDVFDEQSIVIDLLPDTSSQLYAEPDRDLPPASIGAADFGVTLSREESGTRGVRVESVERDSLAARQGVLPDDQLVRLDGLHLYSWRDFAPDPSRTESTVFVMREGLPGVHALRWPHEATVQRAEPFVLVALLLVGLVLGWLSPMSLRPTTRPTGSIEAWLTRLSIVLVLSAALFCAPAAQVVPIWIGMLGLFAALASFTSRQRIVTASLAAAVLSTLTIMLLAKTADVAVLAAAQGRTMLDWYAFRTPASTLAFGGYLLATGWLTEQRRISASLYTATAAVLGAALFLGGWGTDEAIRGVSFLVLKASVLFIVAWLVRMNRPVALVLSGLGLGLAAFQAMLGTDALQPFWGPLAVGCAGAMIARALIPSWPKRSSAVVA
jgi:hypothetical protein